MYTLSVTAYSAEIIVDFEDQSLPVLNDELKRISDRVEDVKDLTSEVEGVLPLINGGTNAALVDPGADRIIFWDDSVNTVRFLTVSTNLTVTGQTITADAQDVGSTLISTESDTTANETVPITIAADKQYLVFGYVECTGGSDAILGIEFNDASNAYSHLVTHDFTGATSTDTYTDGGTYIPIGNLDAGNDKGGAVFKFHIDTTDYKIVTSGGYDAHASVYGQTVGVSQDGHDRSYEYSGYWTNATPTHFKILWTNANAIHTIRVYEYDQ